MESKFKVGDVVKIDDSDRIYVVIELIIDGSKLSKYKVVPADVDTEPYLSYQHLLEDNKPKILEESSLEFQYHFPTSNYIDHNDKKH